MAATATGQKPALSGHCRDAQLAESGVLVVASGPEHHHALCPAAILTPGGKTWRCQCHCHTGDEPAHDLRNPCGDCGSTLTVHNCDEVKDRLASNPTWQRLQKAKEVADVRRAEIAAAEALDRAANPVAPTKIGRCHHCGAPTKGGQFAAGHDMKLKGLLFERARSRGDVEAAAEVVHRGWNTDRIAPSVLAAAEELATRSWFDARISARLVAFDSGADPEGALDGAAA